MKTTLSILALLFVSSIALAQNTVKISDTTKQQKNSLLGGALPGGAVISNAARLSMNVTVAKQTQGATFGEKVNAGLHAAGNALANGSSTAKSPLYNGNSKEGINPLFEPKAKIASPAGPTKEVNAKGGKNN